MEVHFSAEFEAKLNRAAAEIRRAPGYYAGQLVEQYLDHDLWFRQKVAALRALGPVGGARSQFRQGRPAMRSRLGHTVMILSREIDRIEALEIYSPGPLLPPGICDKLEA